MANQKILSLLFALIAIPYFLPVSRLNAQDPEQENPSTGRWRLVDFRLIPDEGVEGDGRTIEFTGVAGSVRGSVTQKDMSGGDQGYGLRSSLSWNAADIPPILRPGNKVPIKWAISLSATGANADYHMTTSHVQFLDTTIPNGLGGETASIEVTETPGPNSLPGEEFGAVASTGKGEKSSDTCTGMFTVPPTQDGTPRHSLRFDLYLFGTAHYVYEWDPTGQVAPVAIGRDPKKAPGDSGVASPSSVAPGTKVPGATVPRTSPAGTSPPSSDSAGGITLRADSRRAKSGETVTVPVWLLKGTGLIDLSFNVEYDSTVAQAVGEVRRGNLLSGAEFEANPGRSGIVQVGLVPRSTGITSPEGTLAQITFKAIGAPGTRTPLRIVVRKATLAGGAPVSPATIHGEITIVDNDGFTPGDTSGDGRVGMDDVLMILKISVELLPFNPRADVDGDGQVTAADARLARERILGKTN